MQGISRVLPVRISPLFLASQRPESISSPLHLFSPQEHPGALLSLQELALAIHAPSVSGKIAIAPNDTMAGYGHGQVICPTRLCNRAHGFGLSDALGDIRIAHRGAHWKLPQSLPDSL